MELRLVENEKVKEMRAGGVCTGPLCFKPWGSSQMPLR